MLRTVASMTRSQSSLAAFALQAPWLMQGQPPCRKYSKPADPSALPPLSQPVVTPTTGETARARNASLRVRQHVNPLAAHFQRSIRLPDDWYAGNYASTALPLTIDVGVARGRWAHAMAGMRPDRNFLGLEIRSGLVASANAVRDRDNLRNLHYLFANANVSFGDIVSSVPPGSVELVCFQFSDPWFKARHAKRRMVQTPIVKQVADALRLSRGQCYLASDILDLAVEMRERFEAFELFERDSRLAWTSDGWLEENPFGVPTEREVAVSKDPSGSVYRAMFRLKELET